MALADGVSFQAASAGTGALTFLSARPSFLTLAQAVAAEELVNGQTITYVAVDSLASPTQREWGIGTFNSAGSGSITRTVVLGTVNLGASGAGAALNFSVAPVVFCTAVTSDIQPTFYVDNATGSDNAAGTSPTAAWASVAKVNGYNFPPGAQILFKGGETFNGALVSPNGGASGNPITFGSFGGGQATINSGASNGFTSTNQSGVIVRDLTFTGTASTNYGILFQNNNTGSAHLQNIGAINCNVSGYGRTGIKGFQANATVGVTAGYDDVVIQGCTVSNCCTVADGGGGTAGIYIFAVGGYGLSSHPVSFNNVVIDTCTVHDCPGASDTNWTGSGIVVAETNQGVVRNCLAFNNGANSIGGGAIGIWMFDSTNVVIEGCTSRNNLTATPGHSDGGGFGIDGGCTECGIRNCYSRNNYGAGYQVYSYADGFVSASDRNYVLNCVSENDGGGASAQTPSGITINSDNVLTNTKVMGCSIIQDGTGGTEGIHTSGANVATISGIVANNSITVVGALKHVSNGTTNPANLTFNGNRYVGAFRVTWNNTSYLSVRAWNSAFATQEAAIVAGVTG